MSHRTIKERNTGTVLHVLAIASCAVVLAILLSASPARAVQPGELPEGGSEAGAGAASPVPDQEGEAAPEDNRIKAFYDSHPELFAQRRIYRFERISIPEWKVYLPDVRSKVEELDKLADKAAVMPQLAAWLRSRNIEFIQDEVSLAPEQVPMKSLHRLGAMQLGDMLLTPEPGKLAVLLLKEAQAQPRTLEQAAPQIRQYLANQAQRRSSQEASTVAGPQPSVASVEELLELIQYRRQAQALWSAVEREVRRRAEALRQNHPDPQGKPDQYASRVEETIGQTESKVLAAYKEALVDAYRRTFNQEEIDSLTAWYRTPAGKAWVEKQPALSAAIRSTMSVSMSKVVEDALSQLREK